MVHFFQRINYRFSVKRETSSLPLIIISFPHHIPRNQDSCFPKWELLTGMGSGTGAQPIQRRLHLPREPASPAQAPDGLTTPSPQLPQECKTSELIHSMIFRNEYKCTIFYFIFY